MKQAKLTTDGLGRRAMSKPIKPDPAAAALEEAAKVSRLSRRRQRELGIVDTEPKVERPNTVTSFVASPTSIAGVLAKHGVPVDTTLAWSRGGQAGPFTASPVAPVTAAPVFLVGAGREQLAELLDGQPVLKVGYHGDALANMTAAVEGNWSRLAREGFPEQYWYKKVGDEFAGDRAADAGGRRWVEVVDTAAVPLETLERLFPRAVVINVVGGWLQGGLRPTRRPAGMAADRYLEVRMADVSADPAGVEHRVLGFLGETPAPGNDAA
jgi:hypothetical protein